MNFCLPAESCLTAARLFENAAPSSREPLLLQLCAAFLTALAKDQQAMLRQTRIAEPFFWDLHEELALVCRQPQAQPDALYDSAFRMLECAAIISRENAGRSGCASEMQKNVMAHFENSGQWPADDPCLACSFYYLLIPRCLSAPDKNAA